VEADLLDDADLVDFQATVISHEVERLIVDQLRVLVRDLL
jgi:hypothetical protein